MCDRLPHGNARIRLAYLIFDVLELDGEPMIRLPLSERRMLFDSLSLDVPPTGRPRSASMGETPFSQLRLC